MPLVSITYVKGRGGATTAALGTALVAPDQARPVLVECDPAGGDLMHRHRLAARPSLVDLATATRGLPAGTSEVFAAGVQQLCLRDQAVEVVVAPAGGAQTRAALPELTRPGQPTLNPPDRLVVADCGRLEPWSPARPVLAASDVVILLVRARADELAHLREHLADLADLTVGRLLVTLTPGGSYPAADVATVLSRHVAEELAGDPQLLTLGGPLPYDRRAAGVLDGDLVAGRRWRRLPLLAALDRLLGELAPLLLTAPRPGLDARSEASR
jgi:hypothetical protein